MIAAETSTEVKGNSIVRRRSGSWVPESSHEMTTMIELAYSKAISSGSGDACSNSRSTEAIGPFVSPNRKIKKALSERRIHTMTPANPSNRSMSTGNLSSSISISSVRQDFIGNDSDGNNKSSRNKVAMWPGADDVKDFNDDSS